MSKNIWILFCLLLTLLMGCQSPVLICEEIPTSENSLFTQSGRLFISGQSRIYEVRSNQNGGFTSIIQLEDANSFYLGMAETQNYLYAICIKLKDGQSQKQCDLNKLLTPGGAYDLLDCLRDILAEEEMLLRAALFDENHNVVEQLEFEKIYTFTDMSMPNGMAADSSGRLYIADETILPQGKIVRLTITDDEPLYEEWLTEIEEEGIIISPNGMAIRENTIYFTNFVLSELKSQVVAAVIDNAGEGRPLRASTLYERSGITFFDDLTTITLANNDYLTVTDYFRGSVLLIEEITGRLAFETDNNVYFLTPTSVAAGKPPLFAPDELIVTQMFGKGLGLFTLPDL